jgi:hypothetical protein
MPAQSIACNPFVFRLRSVGTRSALSSILRVAIQHAQGENMRGRIIHYNSNDGKGLISADNKQHPFEIAQWQSETAPAVNAVVEFDSDGERPSAVRRVSDEALMKEKASELAGKLGKFGGAALQGAQGAAGTPEVGALLARVGKPALIAQAAFVVGALSMAFLKINSGFGPSQGFTLVGLSKFAEQTGLSMGSGLLVWLAIGSLLVPLFWRHRLAWLALLLPLIAVLKPIWDMSRAVNSMATDAGMGAEFSRAMAKQMDEMFSMGLGAWVCGLAGLCLAGIAVKRMLIGPPA